MDRNYLYNEHRWALHVNSTCMLVIYLAQHLLQEDSELPFFFVGIYRPVSFERRPDLTIRWNNPISTLSLHLFSSSFSKSDSLQPPKISLNIDFLLGTILQNGRNGH